MFTGIIETTAKVLSLKKTRIGCQLRVRPRKKLGRVALGESICINGACLSAIYNRQGIVGFDIIPETLRETNLGTLQKGSWVNIERALRYGDRLSGHYVIGHVEAMTKIKKIIRNKKEIELSLSLPQRLKKYLIRKGCIALNGISLTIGKVSKNSFSVYIIPHTWNITNLKKARVGDWINVESDILLKTAAAKK